jgi:hypothetical protein
MYNNDLPGSGAVGHYPYVTPPPYNANKQTYEWVWNSRPMTITEFAEIAYGDTPERTMFLLKYSDKEK